MKSSRIHHSKLRAFILGVTTVTFVAEYSLQAQSTAPDEPKKPAWESTFAAGLTLTRGNSETLLATLTAGTRKNWLNNELSLGADAPMARPRSMALIQKTPNPSTDSFNTIDSLLNGGMVMAASRGFTMASQISNTAPH